MNDLAFRELAFQAGLHLGIDMPQAWSHGEPTVVAGIRSQLLFDDHACCAALYCDLGLPPPEVELAVYRQMLEMQAMFLGVIEASFARDRLNDRILFCARLPIADGLPAERFAQAIQALLAQVRPWLDGMEAGQLLAGSAPSLQAHHDVSSLPGASA